MPRSGFYKSLCIGTAALPWLVLGQIDPVHGQVTRDWDVNAGAYEDGSNWDPTGAPGSGDTLTIDGTDSAATASGEVRIGDNDTGGLTISGGGSLTTSNTPTAAIVGRQAAGDGTVTITDADSQWTSAGNVYIGSFGTGVVNATDGGAFTNQGVTFLGNQDSGSGTLGASGAGSSVTTTGDLRVGVSGTGTFSIEDGAAATATSAVTLGGAATGSGTAGVDGAGSSWTIGGVLSVGNVGTGTLNVTGDGGLTTNAMTVIGNLVASTGTATVDGQGSTWTATGDIRVGGDGTGTLNVTDGGTINTTADVNVGLTGAGITNVSGTDSTLNVGGVLSVANSGGVGTLNVSSGAGVTSTGNAHIGNIFHSVGTVIVDGTGTSFTASSALNVGTSGTGTLTVSDGAGATSTGEISLGRNSGGIGTLNVQSGATLTSDANAFVGRGGTGTATIEGSNSEWSIGGLLSVGNTGVGTLDVENSASLSTTGATHLGNVAGSNGTLTVDGTGSSWTGQSTVNVGTSGTGTLGIQNGGSVTTNADVFVGRNASGSGTAAVDGAGSSWSIDGLMSIGNWGSGTLEIENGGTVTATGVALIANSTGSTGSATVSGSNSFWGQSGLTVGYNGTGTLTVEDHASMVTGGDALIGRNTDGDGTVTVTGAGSSWTVNGDVLSIGNAGDGTLNVTSGGGVTTTGQAFVGNLAGSDGTVTIDGAGSSMNIGTSLFVGGDYLQAGGSGTVQVTGSGTLSVSDDLTIRETGELTVNASTLTAGRIVNEGQLNLENVGINAPLVLDSDADTEVTGTVEFHGPVLGGADFSGTGTSVFRGLYRPANSIATPHFTGNFTLGATGTLAMQVTGTPGVHDKITVDGTATFEDGSTLQLVKIGDAPIREGQTFELVDANGGVIDDGVSLEGTGILGYGGFTQAGSFFAVASGADIASHAESNNAGRMAMAMDADIDAGVTAGTPYATLLGDLQNLDSETLGETLETLVPGNLAAAAPAHHQAVGAFQNHLAAHLRDTNPVSADTEGTRRMSYRGYGTFDRAQSRGDRFAYDSNTAGLIGALDFQIDGNWRAGAAVGLSYTSLNPEFGDGRIRSGRVGPYVAYVDGPLKAEGSVSYGFSSISVDRRPAAGGSVLHSNREAHDIATAIRGGYDFEIREATTVTPFVGLQHIHMREQGYAESGANGAALRVDSRSTNSLNSSIGMTLRHHMQVDEEVEVRPELTLAWGREWLKDDNTLTARFGGGDNSFTTGFRDDRGNSLEAGAGITVNMEEGLRSFVRYDARVYQNNAHSHAVSAGLGFRF